MNAQIDENEKIDWHNLSNKNGEYLTGFSLENISCLNTNFKKKEGKIMKLNLSK